MALFRCIDCGREVSDRATACPHCGHPTGPNVQPPTIVSVEKNSHPFLTFIGGAVIVVGILAAIGAAAGKREARVTPLKVPAAAAPAARFVVTDVLIDENCTELGDYCIIVHCTYQNEGNAAGATRIRADLERKSGERAAVHYGNLTLLPGATQRVSFNFREALLDDAPYNSVCRVGDAGAEPPTVIR